MITKNQWAKLGQGSVLRYKRGKTWVCRTVLLGPANGMPTSRTNGGGVTLIKWQHSQFYNPTTTYFWSDLKNKTEFTGLRVKGERATYPEMRRIKEMFGVKAMEMIEKRLDETQKSWDRIKKWHNARFRSYTTA